jgi:hypothetical protein
VESLTEVSRDRPFLPRARHPETARASSTIALACSTIVSRCAWSLKLSA